MTQRHLLSTNESRKLKTLDFGSTLSNNNNQNASKGFTNSFFPFRQTQQCQRSPFQQSDSGNGLTLYNRNLNGSTYYKPSWVSYPTSISPPQPPLTPNNYLECSHTPPPHFSPPQDNLNYSRMSPVNLNDLRWHPSHYTNPYARNGWIVRRQLVGV